jgi:hypothetical protein
MRGRLIFPFLAELRRLDVAGMVADPDGGGPLTSGYDPDFKESVLIDTNDDGVAERYRLELPPVRVPCQIEPEAFEAMRMGQSGNTPRSGLSLVLHFRDLERLGLVDVGTGDALVRVGDRLSGIYDRAGALVQEIRNPPGLYVTEARAIGFGLNMTHPHRNLLLVMLDDRPQARGLS